MEAAVEMSPFDGFDEKPSDVLGLHGGEPPLRPPGGCGPGGFARAWRAAEGLPRSLHRLVLSRRRHGWTSRP